MELGAKQKEKYYKLLQWQAMPKSKRNPKTVPEFGELIGMSKDEYQFFTSLEDYPNDLNRASKRWHLINRTEMLNKFYEQMANSSRMKPTEIAAYMKLLETDKGDEVGPTYNQFNFVGDLDEKQKRRLAQALKGRLGTKPALNAGS